MGGLGPGPVGRPQRRVGRHQDVPPLAKLQQLRLIQVRVALDLHTKETDYEMPLLRPVRIGNSTRNLVQKLKDIELGRESNEDRRTSCSA